MIVRALLIVLAVALAHPAAATEASAPAKTANTKASAEKGKSAKSGQKPTAPTTSEAKKPAATITATPAQLGAVMRAKRTLRYAADACSRPEKCDEVLRDEAKNTFMDACRACTSEELCEQERDALLNGTAKGSKNPCLP
jgi:hypothetical protein